MTSGLCYARVCRVSLLFTLGALLIPSWPDQLQARALEPGADLEDNRVQIFYSPSDGRCGDYIPFYWDGEWHLFYIHTNGSPWKHIGTRDFVHFTDYGTAIPAGGLQDQDRDIWTGCVIEKDGLFHIFYTGHNGNPKEAGLNFSQVIMHASSEDLVHWQKDPEWRLPPDLARYTGGGWRDPHVFWNPDEGLYWMVLTADIIDALPKRGGCTALFTSKDLRTWDSQGPIWTPFLYDSHECPDVFRMGDWWYLVFSAYSTQWETHYRMARTPHGPWLAPADEFFDGRAFYAAKTATDGQRRFIIGWHCVKENDKDEGKYLWGGNLCVHELVQHTDGTLGVKLLREIAGAFRQETILSPSPEVGPWDVASGRITADAMGRFSFLRLARMPDPCLVTTTMEIEPGTKSCGVMLRVGGANLDQWYQVRLEPGNGRVVFDRANRYFADHSFIEERPVHFQPGHSVKLEVVACGSIFSIYVNGDVALTARGYDYSRGDVGLYVAEGKATFSGTRVSSM
jgi:beta-fructofuranosidase